MANMTRFQEGAVRLFPSTSPLCEQDSLEMWLGWAWGEPSLAVLRESQRCGFVDAVLPSFRSDVWSPPLWRSPPHAPHTFHPSPRLTADTVSARNLGMIANNRSRISPSLSGEATHNGHMRPITYGLMRPPVLRLINSLDTHKTFKYQSLSAGS